MDIREIRNTFDKGGIAVTQAGVMVFYTFKEGCISQGIFDRDEKCVFLELLKGSDKFSIEYIYGKVFKLNFYKTINGQVSFFYPPISKEISTQEFSKILDEISEKCEVDKEFIDAFSEIDLSDEDAVWDKLREIAERDEEKHKTNISRLPVVARWNCINKSVTNLANFLDCDCEVFEPHFRLDYEFEGSITIDLTGKMEKPLVILGNLKKQLVEIIECSSGVEIECDVSDGWFNLTFYA